MNFSKIEEHGYESAILGFSLSYNTSLERTKVILPQYAFGIPGENKFLESIQIWLDINAPRFWWQEFDTYRVGITKQSESTMHTLTKREFTQENFENNIPEEYLKYLNIIRRGIIDKTIYNLADLKNALPEGFLQRRIVNLNYKCFRNIYEQRKNHKLRIWRTFCLGIINSLDHPEFIEKNWLEFKKGE